MSDNYCECAAWTDHKCPEKLDRTAVIVEWMPLHLRASHEAAGNRGAWPHNGSERLRVTLDCAKMAEAYDASWGATVVEAIR